MVKLSVAKYQSRTSKFVGFSSSVIASSDSPRNVSGTKVAKVQIPEASQTRPLKTATKAAAFELLRSVISDQESCAQIRPPAGEIPSDVPQPKRRMALPRMCNAKRPWETPDDEGDEHACGDEDDDFEPDSSCEVSGDGVDDTCEAKTVFGLSSSEDETHDAIPKSVHAGIPEEKHASIPRETHAGIPETTHALEVPEDAHPYIPEGRDEIHGSSDGTVDCCGGFLRGFPARWLSWERFHSEVKEYSARTKQCFIVRSSQTVAKPNQQMRSADRYFPLEWKQYCKTLRCTHGVKQKSRGDGIRQHQYVRFTG
ncbi:unnamed protein product [Phytophthora fragariaefolia]|uniref:Unnamed protein product n=1 Tax=Phytophthora fragariaefolia TaxID=1490495 RepID=A0A9W7CV02_9STRA|nr:unnamed protein product [Phytophthora fragariaefolia]